MHRKLIFLALFASFLVATAGFAANTDSQAVTFTVNEVAELVAGADFSLASQANPAAGADPAGDSDSDTHLQYTSVVTGTGTRSIQVKIDVAPPSGTSLKLTASNLGANGTGAGQIILGTSDQALITGIGSVATGEQSTDGPTMDYVWSIDDVTALDANDTNDVVTVTFTMVADA